MTSLLIMILWNAHVFNNNKIRHNIAWLGRRLCFAAGVSFII